MLKQLNGIQGGGPPELVKGGEFISRWVYRGTGINLTHRMTEG